MANGNDLSPSRTTPVIDFTSQDFDGLRSDFITYAQNKFSDQWTDFNDDQFAVSFLELLAFLGDKLSFQVNSTLREGYAASAVRKQSITNLLKAFGITLDGPQAATVDMELTLDPAGSYPFTIARDDHLFSNGVQAREVFFHPTQDIIVPAFSSPLTVPCTEGEYFSSILIGVSDGSPNQRWQFPQTNVLNDDALELRVGAVLWEAISNFVEQTSVAEVYKVIQNELSQSFAIFGDNDFGAIPATNAEIRASFRVGGGSRGNLNANTIDTIVLAHPNVLSVTNPSASSGGQNSESLREARNVIPGSLKTIERAVTTSDYGTLAELVPGVAKAFSAPAQPAGSRQVNVYVAPTGGGDPSSALKNTVSAGLADKKMVTNRVRTFGPVYKDVRFQLLLHINPSFRSADVNQRTRNTVLNTQGTGLLNFGQLDFAGLDDDSKVLISQTKLQDLFASLRPVGLDRAEIERLDVLPSARTRDGGNSGSGQIADSSIITNTNQKRRRFLVTLISASEYEVLEQITGYSDELTDTVLTDSSKIFGDEGVSDFSGYVLQPDIADGTTVAVASVTGQAITIESSNSLFALTAPGTEYLLFDPTPTVVAVDSQYTSADGSVKFTVASGTTPFINGDAFILDVFPITGDLRLRNDEFPQLLEANFITRTSGGAGV